MSNPEERTPILATEPKAPVESEEKYRHLFEHLNEAAFLTDAETGCILEANRKAEELCGRPRDEIVGMDQSELHPPGKADQAKKKFAAYLAKGNGTDFDAEIMRKDGTVVPVIVSASALTIGGRPLIVGLFRDVTEHKQAEQELRTAKERAERALGELECTKSAAERNAAELGEALFEVGFQKEKAEQARQAAEEANRLMHNILSSVSSIVIGVDEEDRVTQWNAAAEQTFDIQAGDALGRPFSECPIRWHGPEALEAIAAAREADKPVHLDEIRFTRPDDTLGLLGLSVSPMRTHKGEYAGFVLLGADITEQKVMENDLTRAQKLESVGALAAGIAHEINTPIQFVGDNTRFLSDAFEQLQQVLEAYQALKNAVETHGAAHEMVDRLITLEQDADVAYLKEEIPKAIEQTLEGVQRVATIVRAMKDFSHPDEGKKAFADINKALESTLIVARNELKYVADVVTDFDPHLLPVPCYLSDLNQVFLNLLVNAAHAIADVVGDGTKGKGTITASTRQEGNEAVIRIADTGMGIPEKVRHRIFDPFFTTKPVGRGTGQGLSIAHNVVVEKHGGALTFETEVGKGTTFIIRLPT